MRIRSRGRDRGVGCEAEDRAEEEVYPIPTWGDTTHGRGDTSHGRRHGGRVTSHVVKGRKQKQITKRNKAEQQFDVPVSCIHYPHHQVDVTFARVVVLVIGVIHKSSAETRLYIIINNVRNIRRSGLGFDTIRRTWGFTPMATSPS